jgi:hypothetical protein
MFRTLTAVALFGLALSPALADSTFESRVKLAATKACTAEVGSHARPMTFYGPLLEACIRRVSEDTTAKYQNAKVAAAGRIAGN